MAPRYGRALTLLLVFAAHVTMTMSLITASRHNVNVNRGDEVTLTCDIEMEDGEIILKARWFGVNSSDLYGSIDVPKGDKQAIVRDDRIVQYENTTAKTARLSLIIAESNEGDNGMFQCDVWSRSEYSNTPVDFKYDSVQVTVNYIPNTTYPRCYKSPDLPETSNGSSILTCSSEKGRPVVSLEWQVLENSVSKSLSNDSIVVGDHVHNRMNLSELMISHSNSTFTCYMRSEAYPNIIRSCSIHVKPTTTTVTPWIPETTHASSTSISDDHEATTSFNSSNGPNATSSQDTTFASSQQPLVSISDKTLQTSTLQTLTTKTPTPRKISPVVLIAASSGGIALTLFPIILCVVLKWRAKRRGDREAHAHVSLCLKRHDDTTGGQESRSHRNRQRDKTNGASVLSLEDRGSSQTDAGPSNHREISGADFSFMDDKKFNIFDFYSTKGIERLDPY